MTDGIYLSGHRLKHFFLLSILCYFTSSAFATSPSTELDKATSQGSYTGASGIDEANFIELSPSPSSATNEVNLQNAINALPDNGWIVLNDGVYLLESKGYTIKKPINIVSKNRLGATITNALEPASDYGQEGTPLTGSVFVFASGSDGSSIQGINFENIRRLTSGYFAYTAVVRSSDFSFRHNVVKDGGDTNVLLGKGTANHLVEWNAFYNFMPGGKLPRLGNGMFNAEGTGWQYSVSPQQYSDYVLIMNGRNSIIRNNYFHGLFHQTISVAEKLPGTTIIEGNTFDGSALSGIIVGQGIGSGSNFSPNVQSAPLIIKNNVWRAVQGIDGNEYHQRMPIRLGGFSDTVTIKGNVIEGAAVPIRLECVNNPNSSCSTGKITISQNWLTAQATNSIGQTNSDSAMIATSNFNPSKTPIDVFDNVFINGVALSIDGSVKFDNNVMVGATTGKATLSSETGNVTCTDPARTGSTEVSSIEGLGPKILSEKNHPDFGSKTDYPSYYATSCAEPDSSGLNRSVPSFPINWND